MNNEEQQQTGKRITISVPANTQPAFSNATQIAVHNDAVSIQFAYVRPHADEGQLVSEIVLSPKHAMDFQKALNETLKKHFTKHLEE